MRKYQYFLSLVLIVFGLFACEKINYFEDREAISPSTRILLHKGKGVHPDFQPNSLEGVKYGLAHFDGIEVDISVSKEGTVWLSHNNHMKDKNGNEIELFSKTSDKTIMSIRNEETGYHYDKLEAILKYMSENRSDKFISIDTKRPQLLFTRNEYKAIADAIKRFTKKFDNLKGCILIESDCCYFLDLLKDTDGIETYYSAFGDFDLGVAKAYQNEYSGIVFHYGRKDELSSEMIELVHKKGLKTKITEQLFVPQYPVLQIEKTYVGGRKISISAVKELRYKGSPSFPCNRL